MTICEKKAKKQRKALLRFFLYALSGILCALPISIPSLWFIGWIAPIPLLFSELCTRFEKDSSLFAYGRGMSFFWFYGVSLFYWFSELYPLDFLGFEKGDALLVVLLAALGIPLLQSTVSSFVFVALSIVRKRGFFQKHPVISALFVSSLFAVSEFMHTLTFLGVPWGRFAIGQTGFLPVVQSVSLFGSYFIIFIMIFTSSLLAVSLKKLLKRKYKPSALFAGLAVLVFISNLVFGCVKMSVPLNGEEIRVGAVQGNIRFEDKWADKASFTMDTYFGLSKSAALDGADLILWPETAVPYDITEEPLLWDYFSDTAIDCNCNCIVTVFESENGKVYNTARLVDSNGRIDDTVYKKRHLVPFGEYVPMKNLIETVLPPLSDLCSAMDQISPGDSTAVMDIDGKKIGCLICFDSIYEDLCRESVLDGASLICISTNDSWFSKSAALSQHNAQAVLRAIENGRYVVRSANTGISSVISPKGEIIESLGDGEKGFITANVQYIETNTLYTYTGNAFIILCLVFSAAVIFAALIKKRT